MGLLALLQKAPAAQNPLQASLAGKVVDGQVATAATSAPAMHLLNGTTAATPATTANGFPVFGSQSTVSTDSAGVRRDNANTGNGLNPSQLLQNMLLGGASAASNGVSSTAPSGAVTGGAASATAPTKVPAAAALPSAPTPGRNLREVAASAAASVAILPDSPIRTTAPGSFAPSAIPNALHRSDCKGGSKRWTVADEPQTRLKQLQILFCCDVSSTLLSMCSTLSSIVAHQIRRAAPGRPLEAMGKDTLRQIIERLLHVRRGRSLRLVAGRLIDLRLCFYTFSNL